MEVLEKVFAKHQDWLDIVSSFGCNKEMAEDIVSDMYLKIGILLEKGKDISYKDDINHFYIFRTLTTIFLDYKRKEAKVVLIDLDDVLDQQIEQDLDYTLIESELNKFLDNLYWYDKKIYEIVDGGESISELSRKTSISYYSLYNTYKKVKTKIKKILWEIGLEQ